MDSCDTDSDSLVIGFRDRLLGGRRAMAHLIHIWHERNGWSHKVLPALVECLDLGRVHNSQISNLRNGKLASPGPEVFLALAQVNALLHQGIEPIREHLAHVHPELLRVLLDSAIPLIGDDDKPLGAGQLYEIFLGLAPLPAIFDWFIEEYEAAALSAALSDYLSQNQSWRKCREVVMAAYPILKRERRERFEKVMAGLKDYTAEQLDGELIDLHLTHLVLGGDHSSTTKDFLEELRQRALEMKG